MAPPPVAATFSPPTSAPPSPPPNASSIPKAMLGEEEGTKKGAPPPHARPPPTGEAAGDAGAVASLLAGLVAPHAGDRKTVPCSFLYDGPGSRLYDAITDLDAYYPYRAEAGLLAAHGRDIGAALPADAILVELGCGSATKTGPLVAAAAAARPGGPAATTYIGIDCSADFLDNARVNVAAAVPGLPAQNVETICALYLDGARAARAAHPAGVLAFLWLGSSVGNLAPAAAAAFVGELFAIGGGPGRCCLLLCTDLWKEGARLRAAYDDVGGVTAAFIRNGLSHALACLPGGLEAATAAGAHPDAWAYEVLINEREAQVEMVLACPAAVAPGAVAPGVAFAAGERVLMEVSRKFTPAAVEELAAAAGVTVKARWASADYAVQLLA
jgi:L-histidine N-alpha-methyltransferase